MRHPRTYLGLPMPDPTSSESEKGTRGSPAPTLRLTGSGSRLRASQRDCLTTVRSPSGSIARRRADAQRRHSSGRSPCRPSRSLARVETEARMETNELGFAGETVTRWFCSRQELHVTVHRRWTSHNVLGRMWPRRAMRFVAQAFTVF
jgi:hypothetical protein